MLDNSPFFRMIELDSVSSTNSFLTDYHPTAPVDLTLVTAEYQTAGRGQRGNSWESEAGKNLLFSLLVRPHLLPATHLFTLSEAIALSIREAVAKQQPQGSDVTVKWPNDIYVGNHKIGGILIENELQGAYIKSAIIGCGVNVNQSCFTSDAPNPISLRQLLHQDTERSFVLDTIIEGFRRRYATIQRGDYEHLHTEYKSNLYRRQGTYRWQDANGTFDAEIAEVELSGHLVLRDQENKLRRYAFKEVSFA